jgi:hypothetical protein
VTEIPHACPCNRHQSGPASTPDSRSASCANRVAADAASGSAQFAATSAATIANSATADLSVADSQPADNNANASNGRPVRSNRCATVTTSERSESIVIVSHPFTSTRARSFDNGSQKRVIIPPHRFRQWHRAQRVGCLTVDEPELSGHLDKCPQTTDWLDRRRSGSGLGSRRICYNRP